jgi:hypothetical protein
MHVLLDLYVKDGTMCIVDLRNNEHVIEEDRCIMGYIQSNGEHSLDRIWYDTEDELKGFLKRLGLNLDEFKTITDIKLNPKAQLTLIKGNKE